MSKFNIAAFDAQPVLLAETSAEFVAHCLTEINRKEIAARGDDFWDEDYSWLRPYRVSEGILQIPVAGVLLNGFPYAFGTYATGYDYIWEALKRGFDDPQVKGIALIVDSPGGMVAGNFDLVDRMFMKRGEKPVRAFAESAYSAAYAIASAADSITVTRSGGVGSVGVVTSHVDLSRALDDAGIKITFIHAGKHKVDGNPYEPLSDDVKARIQTRIDELYSEFVSIVARNRSMDEQAVRDTEALTFSAREAVSNGMADSIAPLADAVAAFAAELSNQIGEYTMSTTKTDNAAAEQTVAVDKARAEGFDAGKAEGVTAGRKAERERINAILGSEQGKARPNAALAAALDTDMTVEQATAFLAKLPEEGQKPVASETKFEEMMAHGNPGITADTGKKEEMTQSQSILADYRALTGAQ